MARMAFCWHLDTGNDIVTTKIFKKKQKKISIWILPTDKWETCKRYSLKYIVIHLKLQ